MPNPAILSRRDLAAALPIAALAGAMPAVSVAARPAAAAASDPVFAQIERHKALRIRANTVTGRDDDPAYVTACEDEEAALQALGDMLPISIAGAIAQLRYMAEVEGCFADAGSPLLRTVLSVAAGLAELGGPHA